MTEPLQTPAARQEAARAAIKQREDGIHGAGVKKGYAERDAVWHKALGVTTIDEAREVTELRKRPTLAEEHKHVRGAFAWGIVWGGLGGVVLGSCLSLFVATSYGRAAFQNAQQATQQGALIGAAAANQQERVPHYGPPQ